MKLKFILHEQTFTLRSCYIWEKVESKCVLGFKYLKGRGINWRLVDFGDDA